MDVKELIEKASKNVPSALNDLGVACMTGDGMPRNTALGVRYFQRAADSGYPPAMSNYGMSLLTGNGIEKDAVLGLQMIEGAYLSGAMNALDCVLRAVATGDFGFDELSVLAETNSRAMWMLGVCYGNGVGTEMDRDRANELLDKACNMGNPAARWIAARFLIYAVDDDLLLAKHLLYSAIMELKEYGYVNAQMRKDLHVLYEKMESACKACLMKVVPACEKEGEKEDKYVQDLLDGKLFVKKLAQFANLQKRDESSNNSFRGDSQEGTMIPIRKNYDQPASVPAFGVINDVLQQKKTYSLTILDIDQDKNGMLVPSRDIAQFGKYAVIITDTDEFLRRIRAAFEGYCERDHAGYSLRYGRVIYDAEGNDSAYLDEFHKVPSYSWQNEFRISLDFSEGKLPEATWNNMTDYAKLCMPHDVEIDRNPLSKLDSMYFEIGDIRDICVVLTTEELWRDGTLRSGIEPAVIPSYSSEQTM